jgi:hypothetical protein
MTQFACNTLRDWSRSKRKYMLLSRHRNVGQTRDVTDALKIWHNLNIWEE